MNAPMLDAIAHVATNGDEGQIPGEAPARRRDLPDGRWLEFTEEPRRAYRLFAEGEKPRRLPSVTTVLGVLSKPALIRWAEARGAEGAVRAVLLGELDPQLCEPTEAVETVRALGLGADAAKNKAAGRGLDVHGALEWWCEHGDLPQMGDIDDDARDYLKGLAAFLMKYKPEPIHTERMVCHPGLLYAGRYDLWCLIGGQTAIVDLKTQANASVYDSHCLQLEGYVAAEVACGEEVPVQQLVVSVGTEGRYTVQPSTAPEGAFAQVFKTYEMMKAIRRPLEQAARARAKERAAEVAA